MLHLRAPDLRVGLQVWLADSIHKIIACIIIITVIIVTLDASTGAYFSSGIVRMLELFYTYVVENLNSMYNHHTVLMLYITADSTHLWH